jgi:predicted  nucleic acid-binding Zn-ribbon protein
VRVRLRITMNPDIHLVLRLQSLDSRISDLEKEVAALPKHIAEIEKALDIHQRRLEADRAALVANQKERKKLEGDIQLQEQKISKLRDQTLQAKTNDQYRAFQHEVEYCQTEIRKAEDRILDLMGESEPLEANVKKAEAALKAEREEVEVEKKKAREQTAADQEQLAGLRRDRTEVAQQIPASLNKLYEKVRRKWHGAALAEVQESRCTGCFIILRPQHFQDLRGSDKVMTCESCGRILYYNPPTDIEKEMAGGTRVNMT